MLAVPGMLMLCTEWWSFEVGTFLMGEYNIPAFNERVFFRADLIVSELYAPDYLFVGTFGKQQLAAHGILMQFSSFVYLVSILTHHQIFLFQPCQRNLR